jgi:hypothetical protein
MCIKLVIKTNLYYDARSEKHQIKLRENPFNGSRIFMGVQTDARTMISVSAVRECKYT